MFSLQNFVAKDEKWFDLLESGAEEARASIQNLIQMLKTPGSPVSLETFVQCRRKEKLIVKELREHLLKKFLAPLEREDIEDLILALYKIPKTVEKFSERFLIARAHAQRLEVSRQMAMLEKASEIVVLLVRELRSGVEIKMAQSQNDELQRIEGEADKLMLESLDMLVNGQHETLQIVVLKDLYELLEKIFDRCRDAGNVIFHVALKYA